MNSKLENTKQIAEESTSSTEKQSGQCQAFAIGEVCFIILPFIVMLIVFAYNNNIIQIFMI